MWKISLEYYRLNNSSLNLVERANFNLMKQKDSLKYSQFQWNYKITLKFNNAKIIILNCMHQQFK
jgi:hypothetical protein